MATIAENQPNRPRGAIRTFPDRPITISVDRIEAARKLLGSVHELWEQGQYYPSLQTWFTAPIDQRDDVINSVLLGEAESADRSLRDVQYNAKGKPESLVLDHYALLTSAAAGKIINPSGTTVTLDDANKLSFNPGERSGNNCFAARLWSIGLGDNHYYHDVDDFTEPRSDIIRNFNLEEARELLIKLIPHIDPEDELVKERLLSNWGIVAGIRHADLLTDPRLADHLEKALINEVPWFDHLENFLAQRAFPSAAFFEEAFKRLSPQDSDPNAVFKASIKSDGDTPVPASLYYFNMLRKTAIPTNGQPQIAISYLLSAAFMEHALPYLNTVDAYSDDFIDDHGDSKLIFHNERIEATGDEGRDFKRERFREIMAAVEKYLREKGDTRTLETLKAKEVAGIKFSDYWPTETTPRP